VATLFSRSFEYVRIPKPTFDSRGNAVVAGNAETRTVRGTVQPMNGKETVPAIALSRNTGTVKVYSSERLDFRSEDGDGIGYVRCGGYVYEIVDELPEQNGLISHWKYIACLVPPSQVEDAILVVDILCSETGEILVSENGEVLIAE